MRRQKRYERKKTYRKCSKYIQWIGVSYAANNSSYHYYVDQLTSACQYSRSGCRACFLPRHCQSSAIKDSIGNRGSRFDCDKKSAEIERSMMLQLPMNISLVLANWLPPIAHRQVQGEGHPRAGEVLGSASLDRSSHVSRSELGEIAPPASCKGEQGARDRVAQASEVQDRMAAQMVLLEREIEEVREQSLGRDRRLRDSKCRRRPATP